MAPPHLDVGDNLAGLGLVPPPIQVFRDEAQLDCQFPRKILRRRLATLFPPKPQERTHIIAHNEPGVGTANETPPICRWQTLLLRSHAISYLKTI
jgi:hypothetical protein